MGAVLSAITTGEGIDVISVVTTALVKLPELIECAVSLLKLLKNVFNNAAQIPRDIHENVISFERDICKNFMLYNFFNELFFQRR